MHKRNLRIIFLFTGSILVFKNWPTLAERYNGGGDIHQCGYIDRTGKFVIKPIFKDARDFSEGLAAVQVGEDWGYINKQGKFIIRPQFKSTGDGYGEDDQSGRPFRHGRAAIFSGGKKSSGGWYWNGKWGYINKTGAQVITPQFDWACEFSEEGAVVFLGQRRLLIDLKGHVIKELGPSQYYVCEEGSMAVPNRLRVKRLSDKRGAKYGYVDELNNVVIPPQFDEAGEFSEGLAAVDVYKK